MEPDRLWIGDGHGVFRDRSDHGDNIDFLNPHLSDAASPLHVGSFYLARNEQTWRRILPCPNHASDRVRRAWPSGYLNDAKATCGLRVRLGRDCRSLLVKVANKF